MGQSTLGEVTALDTNWKASGGCNILFSRNYIDHARTEIYPLKC